MKDKTFFLLIFTNGEDTIRLYTVTPRKREKQFRLLGYHLIHKVRYGK